MIGARKPRLPLVNMKTTAIIIAAKITTLMTRDTLPGSVLTRARIIKYRVAAPRTKKTNTFIIIKTLMKRLVYQENKSTGYKLFSISYFLTASANSFFSVQLNVHRSVSMARFSSAISYLFV